MNEEWYYLEEDDFRPYLESEMQDPTNGREDEDNYEEPLYPDDLYLDADALGSAGWGEDEYYNGGEW